MWYLTFIGVVAGILAVSEFIIAKKPNAKELIYKITPYRGWIGLVVFFYGFYDLFAMLRFFGGVNMIMWVLSLVISVSEVVVGFVLGYGLISKYALSKNETALKKGQALREKLLKFQVPAGIIVALSSIHYIENLLID